MKKSILLIIGTLLIQASIRSQDLEPVITDTTGSDFFDISLEDLMNIEVTSVSKKSERQQDVASSIYVVTQEMIEQSGATRIQDVLNMVPGVFFQFENYTQSSLGLREAANPFSGSVLVLIDNVPLQSPLYSTFQWQNFDFDLLEIDRIEVIKGPGGTIYGANAATGIINIYTKQAKDSQGIRASLQTGTNGLVIPSIRYGTKLNEKHSISLYGKGHFFNGFRPLDELNGNNTTVPKHDINGDKIGDTTINNKLNNDVYRTSRLTMGVRTFSDISDQTKVATSFYASNHKNQSYNYLLTQSKFNLLDNSFTNFFGTARIDHEFSDQHSIFTQYSTSGFKSIASNGNSLVTTSNLEIQDNFKIGINNLSIGLNGRTVEFNTSDVDTSNSDVQFIDPNSSEYLLGAFVQNKLVFSEKIDLTLGIKGEVWTLIDTKPEWSPSARFSYKPNKRLTFWGAASRSVTTPGFIQTNIELKVSNPSTTIFQHPQFGPIPINVPGTILTNGENIDQSEYITYEAGIKGGKGKFSFDLSGFYTIADKLIGLDIPDLSTPANIPNYYTKSKLNPNETVLPFYYANNETGINYGGEAVIKYIPTKSITTELSYTYFKTERKQDGVVVEFDNPATPEHTIAAKVYITLPRDVYLSFNALYMSKFGTNIFSYVDQRPPVLGQQGTDFTLHEVKDKYRLDFRLEKRFDENASIYLWGMDMLNFGTIQQYSGFSTGIPYQTHFLAGIGTNLSF